jgi:tetratricopeptide (TPR) repeat protein
MRFASLSALFVLSISSLGCLHSADYYIQRGNQLFSSGKFAEASLNYRHAVQKDTNSAEAHFRLGISETRQQHWPDAWQELNRASNLAQQRQDILIELGEVCLSILIADPVRPRNVYDRIIEVSNSLLAKDAGSFEGLRFKGYIALFDRRLDAAIDSFKRAHQLKPSQQDVAISLVETLFQANLEGEAEQIDHDFIKANPSSGSAYDALYAHYLARGRNTDAEDILKLKVANNPNQPSYVTQLCRLYWRLGKQEQALDLTSKMLATDGTSSLRHLAAGDFYGSVERWRDATQQFELAMTIAPSQKVLFQKRIADVLLAQGNKTQAAKVVDDILKQEPRDPEAWRIRAGLKVESNNREAIASAISDYKELLRENAGDAGLHYALGLAFVASGDLASAKPELREAIRLQPGYILPRNALAEVALKAGKPDEALRWCSEAIEIDPSDNRPRFLKSVALQASGQYSLARNELNAILRAVPDSPEALLQLGLLDVKTNDYKAAEAAFATLQRFSANDAAHGLAAMYASQGQIDKSIDLLRKAPNGNQTDVHHLIGVLAIQGRKYDLAIEEFRALVAADPQSVEGYLRLAEYYRLKGDWSDSIATLERAETTIPGDARPILILASTLEATGSMDQAIEQYRRALKVRPEDPNIMNNIAYLIVETEGNLDEALRLAQQAVRKEPGQPSFADTLGWVYLKRQMPDNALQVFNTLIQKQPNDATFHYHRGAALLQKGDKSGARLALETALTKSPSKQEADKIRELLAKAG